MAVQVACLRQQALAHRDLVLRRHHLVLGQRQIVVAQDGFGRDRALGVAVGALRSGAVELGLAQPRQRDLGARVARQRLGQSDAVVSAVVAAVGRQLFLHQVGGEPRQADLALDLGATGQQLAQAQREVLAMLVIGIGVAANQLFFRRVLGQRTPVLRRHADRGLESALGAVYPGGADLAFVLLGQHGAVGAEQASDHLFQAQFDRHRSHWLERRRRAVSLGKGRTQAQQRQRADPSSAPCLFANSRVRLHKKEPEANTLTRNVSKAYCRVSACGKDGATPGWAEGAARMTWAMGATAFFRLTRRSICGSEIRCA